MSHNILVIELKGIMYFFMNGFLNTIFSLFNYLLVTYSLINYLFEFKFFFEEIVIKVVRITMEIELVGIDNFLFQCVVKKCKNRFAVGTMGNVQRLVLANSN